MLSLTRKLPVVVASRVVRVRWRRSLHCSRVVSLSPQQLQGQTVRIGCSSGFWGDTTVAAPQLVHHGELEYLVSDYLSEITMSLLAAVKAKRSDMGYTPDFVQSLAPLLGQVKQSGLKVISNAGGINPSACVKALQAAAKQADVKLSVAMVTGDDLLAKRDEVVGESVTDLETGVALPNKLFSMNAYLGAFPIAEALRLGADIVVTGRCTDSALVLAPLIHKFGWTESDFDLLAAGSLAGHIIECGAQATGGIFTDWDKVQGWERIGFPIVECSADGRFILSKPENTGGLISWGSAAEQLVYEIGDPRAYLLPDVTCDFSKVEMEEVGLEGAGRGVLVTGARGRTPSDNYKVSATYSDGYRVIAVCPVIGPRAIQKSKKTAAAILDRTREMLFQKGMKDYDATNIHVIGSEASYGPSHPLHCREVVMWIGVQHQEKAALEIFAREVAPAGTSMAPGLTTLIGGRPTISPVLRLFSFLYPKTKVPVSIAVDGEQVKFHDDATQPSPSSSPTSAEGGASSEYEEVSVACVEGGNRCYRLEELAFLRSGDKGNTANIGVVARKKSYLPYIRRALSVEAVSEYFSHFLEEGADVRRYDLEGIGGLNFVLTRSLGGGGVSSLRIDPQGKAYAQMLADFEVLGMPYLSEL